MSMRSPKKIAPLLLISLMALFLYFAGLSGPINKFLSRLFLPLQSTVVRGSKTFNEKFRAVGTSKQNLIDEVRELKQEMRDITVELISAQGYKKENETLRRLLAFRKENPYTLVMTDIIHKTDTTSSKTLVLNKGSDGGIQVGDAVVIGEGTLIGTVIKVQSDIALVRLTVDHKSNILATTIDGEHAITGIVRGVPGSGLELNLVPKYVPLKAKQKIITNGLQEGIPPGLYLGNVITVDQDENKILNSAVLESPYFIEDITVAAVILKILAD